MRFYHKKRTQPPSIIIVSLIDILIVLLIFMMVTTTFKQQPALKLALPESQQSKSGASDDNLVVTVAKQPPYLYLGTLEVTPEQLKNELTKKVAQNPQIKLAIRADTDAPFGQIIKVMDIAKLANIKAVNAFTKTSTK